MKTKLEKFAEANLRLETLVDELNNEFRVQGMTELYFLKVNRRTMAEVMTRCKNADRADLTGVLFPRASRCVQ